MKITVREIFDSGVNVSAFISQMQEEFEPYNGVARWRLVEWINALEQLIYSDIVQYESYGEVEAKLDETYGTQNYLDEDINYISFKIHPELSAIRAGDIFAVKADGVMLASGRDYDSDMIDGTWYDRRGRLHVNVGFRPKVITVYFYARPKLISEENIAERDVHVPPEFIDLFRTRIRGEFYKLVNEDMLAAKWVNEYNAILEDFKEWCKRREELFK